MSMPIDLTTFLHNAPVFLLQAHAEAEAPMGLWETILHSNVFNVLLVAVVLSWIIKKNNLFKGVDDTQAKIASEIAEVERQKQEALAQLEDAKRRTANLSAEVEVILKNARESAETLSAQIIEDARVESGKIVENARKRVELEQRSAIKNLESRLLSDALSDARQELARSMTATDQRRSVEAFLDDLAHMKGGQ
jgi:F-type H+-transporting ATPase subunit b